MNDFEQYINKNEIYLFNIGEAQQAYATFGCHRIDELGMHRFLVWAPNARQVSVVGDFNGWDAAKNRMRTARYRRICRVCTRFERRRLLQISDRRLRWPDST